MTSPCRRTPPAASLPLHYCRGAAHTPFAVQSIIQVRCMSRWTDHFAVVLGSHLCYHASQEPLSEESDHEPTFVVVADGRVAGAGGPTVGSGVRSQASR